MSWEVRACRWCGVAVYRLLNDHTGNPGLVDVATAAAGNITVDLTGGTYHVLHKEEPRPPAAELHLSHWASCSAGTKARERTRGRNAVAQEAAAGGREQARS